MARLECRLLKLEGAHKTPAPYALPLPPGGRRLPMLVLRSASAWLLLRPQCPTATQDPANSQSRTDRSPRRGAFFFSGAGWLHAGYTVQNPVPVATWWLHGLEKRKTPLPI